MLFYQEKLLLIFFLYLIGGTIETISNRLFACNGMKVSPAFEKYTMNYFPNIQDRELWNIYEHWLDLHFLNAIIDGERDKYMEQFREYKEILSEETYDKNYVEDFNEASFLPKLYDKVDSFIAYKIYEDIGVSMEYPKGLWCDDDETFRKNWKAFLGTALNKISSHITHASLWESYAKVLEYIDRPDEFEIPPIVDEYGKRRDFNAYYDPLLYMQKNIPGAADNNKVFLQVCLLLFDIIFAAPILPQCVFLRSGSILDYDLPARFYAVNEAAYVVGSLKKFKSSEEYVATICGVLGWPEPNDVYFQLFRCWDSVSIVPDGRTLQYFLVSRLMDEYPTFNRQALFDVLADNYLNPCFLKLKDKIIINTRMAYKPEIESWAELCLKSAINGWDLRWPEAFESDDTYYQYFLLHDLVRQLWFYRNKDVAIYVPEICQVSGLEVYLQDWIDKNHIDARIRIRRNKNLGTT